MTPKYTVHIKYQRQTYQLDLDHITLSNYITTQKYSQVLVTPQIDRGSACQIISNLINNIKPSGAGSDFEHKARRAIQKMVNSKDFNLVKELFF